MGNPAAVMSTPITIKGIRIEVLNITRDSEGRDVITSTYALISSADKVLAKQEVGGYNGLKVQPSASTLKLFGEAIAAYKADINTVIGLEG